MLNNFIIKFLLNIGLLHSTIIFIGKNWRTKIPTPVLLIIASIFLSQIKLIEVLFSKLPEGTIEFLLENITDFKAAILLIFVCLLGVLGLCYSIAAAKVIKVLV